MPLFERASDAAALVNHRQFDAPIGAPLRAKNAAIGFRVLKYVADDFAQAVGERCSHFELIALRDETGEAFALLMDHASERLSGFEDALIEFCSRERSDGKPCCAARHRAGNIANGDAEPLEEADMSEILVRRLAGADTLRGNATIFALSKKRTQRSADIKQAERFDAAKRSEVNRRRRCGNVGGQSGSEVERGARIERRRQRDGVHAASYGVGVIASNPEALGPLHERQADLEYCLMKIPQAARGNEEFMLHLTIAPKGNVLAATVAGDENAATIAKCVQAQTRRWSFPLADAPSEIDYPLSFSVAQ